VKANGRIQIELLPLGRILQADPGTALQDLLFAHGVEFPCGAQGLCKGCRIRVLDGTLPPTEDDFAQLSPFQIDQGWRLACRARAESNLKIELAQWEIPILSDESPFSFAPQPGLGVAIDLGTTTIVAQLLDLSTSHVLAVRTAINRQAQYGSDVMSRIQFATHADQRDILTRLVRQQLGEIIAELLFAIDDLTARLEHIVIVGNTVMQHLFTGLDLESLSHSPFEPVSLDLQEFTPAALAWDLPGNPIIRFLPVLGGFVGSDLLAGILATQLHEGEHLSALIDLGTNAEIVVGNRHRILCASAAAGPAFEGARISQGMSAATGAISAVHVADHQLHCHVIGQVPPRGICGSGLVDAVAAGLDLGKIAPSGRLLHGPIFPLIHPVSLTQPDIRELQLAKASIAAGLRLLLQQWGAQPYELEQIHLAGAFGNYINRTSARRIGLLPTPPGLVKSAGNSALLGAKIALFNLHQSDPQYFQLRNRIQHVPLNEDPAFQDVFVSEMPFPE
jgi:uncharacterized 2Fe-2S/4Fe-4S cluster protein (DUF4445 family)